MDLKRVDFGAYLRFKSTPVYMRGLMGGLEVGGLELDLALSTAVPSSREINS